MVARVLIVGGYGNFGAYVAKRLSKDRAVQVIIGGRNGRKAQTFAGSLESAGAPVEWREMDVHQGFSAVLAAVEPDIVIHTSGPFQGQGYHVAEACIEDGVHYLDLADARSFVCGFSTLHEAALRNDVLAVSGASSVPCLTAAVLDAYIGDFQHLREVEYGIATAQQTNRGLATTSAVLSYAGKPLTTLIDGNMRTVFGWQDIHMRELSDVGRRFFANCDVPDLDLFPARYPDLRTLRFFAGLEVPAMHVGLWLLTWLVRAGVLRSADVLAKPLLAMSRCFDRMGSDTSAFFMAMTGAAPGGNEQTLTFTLTARSGDGPYIPCAPAIILARALANGQCPDRGARACVGLVDLKTYLSELAGLDISWNMPSPCA